MIERLGVYPRRTALSTSSFLYLGRRLKIPEVQSRIGASRCPLSQSSLSNSPSFASCRGSALWLQRYRCWIPASSLKTSERSSHRDECPFGSYGYHRVALIGSATFTLCRSREARRGSDQSSGDLSPTTNGDQFHGPRPSSDSSVGVEIPIDFGPSSGFHRNRRHTSTFTDRHNGTGFWDRFKGSLSYNRLFSSSGRDGFGKGDLLGIFPFLSKVSPSDFGNVFLIGCCGVFGLWHLGDRLSNPWLAHFMQRHFVASRSAFDLRRYHTLLTCAVSHSSFMHLVLNCAMFYQLVGTFQRHMSSPVGSTVTSPFDRFIGGVYSSVENMLWGEKRPLRQRQHVQTGDIVNVMLLSAIGSSLGHVFLYRTPVIGASGAISGLLYLLASTFPNSYFRTVFPIPGLELSILQVGQMFVLTNLYFLYFGSGWRNVAWAAHLFGMGTGALYCYAQQHLFNRPGFHNPVTMSFRSAKRQWLRTLKGIGGRH